SGRKAQEMPAVPAEPIVRFSPKVGGFVGDDLKAIVLRKPSFRFVQPRAIVSAKDRVAHVKPWLAARACSIACTSDRMADSEPGSIIEPDSVGSHDRLENQEIKDHSSSRSPAHYPS